MKFQKCSLHGIVILAAIVSTLSWGSEPDMMTVSLDDPNLHYLGIRYVDIQPGLVSFSRFDPESLSQDKQVLGFNPYKARNTTGGVIAFQTDSPTIRLKFRTLEGLNRGSEFAVFMDGQFIESHKFNPKQKGLDIEIDDREGGKPVLWELTLPSFANIELVSFEIEKHSQLTEPEGLERKVYVAIGDSISHGTGQGSATHLTWPFILSRKLGYTLYNLAVGGSGVSVAAGRSLAAFDYVDLVTILIGYNDWNGEGDSVQLFQDQYRDLLRAIRAAQPDVPVFCISPLYTNRDVSKKSGLPIESFRTAVQQLEEELSATDSNLHFIAGESVSSAANLRSDKPDDPVHLGIDGAALLAESLYPLIIKDLK